MIPIRSDITRYVTSLLIPLFEENNVTSTTTGEVNTPLRVSLTGDDYVLRELSMIAVSSFFAFIKSDAAMSSFPYGFI